MIAELFAPLAQTPFLAEAAIDWTPETFYATAAVVHTVIYLLGFRLMQVDPEHNTFVGAVIAAVIANFAAFALSSFGLFGILGAGFIHFAVLAAISSGEVLKSLVVFLVALGAYAGLAQVITERSPLTVEEIGGIPQAIVTGGLEAEPMTEEID